MKKWDEHEIPFLEGRVALVSGANSGLGYHTARALACAGSRVVMACRNLEKGEAARKSILGEHPSGEVDLMELDLASLASVRNLAAGVLDRFGRVDILVNNAGLMAIPYARTREGFEMQFGVNHLGHFALTALLWPGMQEGARVVAVSSLAHAWGRIRFEDMHWESEYRKWAAYGMSKLANLLFMSELSRRLEKQGRGVLSLAAHPGYANTSLQTKSMEMAGATTGARLFELANRWVAQSGRMGALPSLFAATSPEISQGAFYGPGGLLRMKGYPVRESLNSRRVNELEAQKLWGVSEELTGIAFPAI